MDQNFQTSFIPKKPMIEQKTTEKRPIGIFVAISLIIFLAIALISGGAYFYKSVLIKNLSEMKANLELAKNRFEPSKIAQLQTFDKRLISSTEILSKHIAISPIFQVLQDSTLKTIRYTDFGYEMDDKTNTINIKMSGQAVGYRSIALQSDLLVANKNFIDPVFSNLLLDEKGNVLFDLQFSVDPSFVNYKQVLKTEDVNSSVTEGVGTVSVDSTSTN
ncbi:MAG TPA: hypothetical protein PKZ36_02435 [Candidatus Paceibacterota bacterium]|nr:hypothetical protein [Candidatus Paceibacterota bacterium]HPT18239.1 hypothetical protein [Candidatus Paceibacterota bacterium]